MNALARCVVCVVLCSMPLCGGCAKYNFQEAMPSLDATGSGSLVVATHDQRPYVVSGGTDPALIGLLRSLMGIPWPVLTESGRPVAEDMTQMLCRSLHSKGFHCLPVFLEAQAKPNEIRRKLQEHSGMSAMLLVLHEWKSDTHTDTTFAYDATLNVLDPSGAPRAVSHIQGRDVLGGTFWNARSFAHTAVPEAVKKNLEELLNDPAIIAALQTIKR